MAIYNQLPPTQVKTGYGSNSWTSVSSGGAYAFGRSSTGHWVTILQFKVPTTVSNITKITLYVNSYSTVGNGYTTQAKLNSATPNNATTTTPTQWLNHTALSTSTEYTGKNYSSSGKLTTVSYTFSSGLSSLTAGKTFFIWIYGTSASSYSEGKYTATYPYIDITYSTTYTITYNPNGASGSNVSDSVSSGSNYTLRSSCPWTRSGYTFKGWSATTTGTTPAQSTQTCTGNKTWYAIWEKTVIQYTARFYPGDYATVSNTYANSVSRTYTEGGSLTLLSNTVFTGKTGYTYYTTKYYLQGGDVTGYNYPSSSSSYTRSGSSSNYCYDVRDDKKTSYSYEYWHGSDTSGVRKCGDTYNNLNGDINMWPYWSETVNYNAQFNPPDASRIGYRLKGWATSSAGSPNYQSGTNYQQSSNKTLYAIWEANQVYINYYTDNDTAQPTDTIVQGPYNVGDTVQLSNGSGWISSKWGSSVTFYTNYNFQGGSFSNGVTPNSTYSTSRIGKYDWVISGWFHGSQYYELQDWITLDSNIGIYPYWADSSSIVSHAAFTPITPIRKGYKFLNWNTETNGNGIAYYAGTNYNTSAIDKNLTLYAIWEPEWTIKINNGTNWGNYHVWIYTGAASNNGWQQAIPYVYDGSNWKLTKI